MLNDYRALFNVEFREFDGCVLACIDGQEPRHRKCQTLAAKAQQETEENRQSFLYPIGNTTWERWQNNLTLALSVKTYWCAKLNEAFPRRQFTSFIWNEIAEVSAPDASEHLLEIMPRLRIWSRKNDPNNERYNSYRVNDSTLDTIKVRRNNDYIFVPSNEVFTKTGSIRKQFLNRFEEADLQYIR